MQLEKNYIYQVYLHGSFSKAADALFITQPALSIAIKKVEQELGAPLFNRGQRPLTLTAIGELYIEHIKKELLLEQELEQQLNDIRNVQAGSLIIGGTHYMNADLLPSYIARFHSFFPNIDINIVETSSDQLIELLRDNEIDVTFSCDEDVIKEFKHRPAFSDNILLAVPASFPVPEELAHYALDAEDVSNGRHLDPEWPALNCALLPPLNFILTDPHVNLGQRTLRIFAEAGLTPQIKIKVPQLVTAFELADSGIGVTFVSDCLICRSGKSNLSFFKLDTPLAHRDYSLLLPKRSYIAAAIREFSQLFRE